MEDGNLKITFSEILRGYTLVDLPNHGKIRIKHFNNFDSAELDIKNQLFYNKAVKEGLPTREERVNHLLEEDIWTEEKSKKIIQLRSFVAGLQSSRSKVFLKAHIDQINNDLKKNQSELSALTLEKEELIGFTADSYAARRNKRTLYEQGPAKRKRGKTFRCGGIRRAGGRLPNEFNIDL